MDGGKIWLKYHTILPDKNPISHEMISIYFSYQHNPNSRPSIEEVEFRSMFLYVIKNKMNEIREDLSIDPNIKIF